jgi:hypothetical protein
MNYNNQTPFETLGGPSNNYSFQNQITNEKKNTRTNNPIKKTNSFQFENDFLNHLELANIREKEEENLFNNTMPIINFQFKESLNEPEKMIIEFFNTKKSINKNNINNNPLSQSSFFTPKDFSILNSSILTGTSTTSKNQYLTTRKLINVSYNEIEYFINSLGVESLNGLENLIRNRTENFNSFSQYAIDNPINPFDGLVQLIDKTFSSTPNPILKMKKNYEKCKNIVFKYRRIKPDGNCFYRAIIIRYLELIILSNDIDLFKNVFWDMKNCYENKEILNLLKVTMNYTIKPGLMNKLFALIYLKLKDNNITDAYYLFTGSLLFCPIFDFGLVLYCRYILYQYIKENEDKYYSKEFNVLVGNLLPAKFETEDSKFLFKDFYKTYLLKMFQDAEKIIIYLTPYVLSLKLKIIFFEDESDEFVKEFNFIGKQYNKLNDIFLINKKNHYDLLYSKSDYSNYGQIFKILTLPYVEPRIFKIKEESENINSENLQKLFTPQPKNFETPYYTNNSNNNNNYNSNNYKNNNNDYNSNNNNYNRNNNNNYNINNNNYYNTNNNNNYNANNNNNYNYNSNDNNYNNSNNNNNYYNSNNNNNYYYTPNNNNNNNNYNTNNNYNNNQINNQKLSNTNKEISKKNFEIFKNMKDESILKSQNMYSFQSEQIQGIENPLHYSEINLSVNLVDNQNTRNNNNSIIRNIDNNTEDGLPENNKIKNNNNTNPLYQPVNNIQDIKKSQEYSQNNSTKNSIINSINNFYDDKKNKKKILTPQNNCIFCEKILSDLGVCDNCLKKIIDHLQNTFKNYLIYAKAEFNKLESKIEIKFLYNKFFGNNYNFKFDNKEILLKDLYGLINVNKDSLNKTFKNNLCINCLKTDDIENISYIVLPCKCCICNKECLKKFFHQFNFKQKSPSYEKNRVSYVCLCSEEYTNFQVLEMCYIFYSNELKDDYKKALNLYNTNKYFECANCIIKFKKENQKNKINIYQLMKNQNPDFIKFLKDNKIEGFLCDDCYSRIINNFNY